MDACKTCRARVVWAETNGGKLIPIDPEPNLERGNVTLLEPVDPRDPPIAVMITKSRPRKAGEVVYTSHFATCPDAAMHRKGGAT